VRLRLRLLFGGLFLLRPLSGADPDFLTLGIETSCDDTGIAVLRGGREVLASRVASQIEAHAAFGGVVPELASRMHQEAILPLLRQVLEEAGVRNPARELDLIAVTAGPGLMGSLLVGVMTAKALAQAWELPILGVNHLEGHLFANLLASEGLRPPFLACIISGGHSEVLQVRSFGDYEPLGATRDDAAGEAFDKAAKILGLPYPGGPPVDDRARRGDPRAFPFPIPLKGTDRVEFSFSGLKTALLWTVRRIEAEGRPLPLEDLCASFQAAVVEALLEKVCLAVDLTGIRSVAFSGGVAANSGLREEAERRGGERGFRVHLPPRSLCSDNAAMIAAAGCSGYRRGLRSDLSLAPDPSWPLCP
jgi:N6-L-threonylcarbamoyladenine synthase